MVTSARRERRGGQADGRGAARTCRDVPSGGCNRRPAWGPPGWRVRRAGEKDVDGVRGDGASAEPAERPSARLEL